MESNEFEDEVARALPKLRGVVRRMLGNPDDTEEIVQDTLLKAFEKRETFRGDSAFGTWLVSIGTRMALNHLRSAKRWTWDAQDQVAKSLHSQAESREQVMSLVASPGSRFDAREHIAFCFTCVGRSLEPDEQAALVLRDVFEYSNREASKIVEVTESVLRARVSSARKEMQSKFENLCGLINKEGVCHQCKGLRNRASEEQRGEEIPDLSAATGEEALYQLRLGASRDADVDGGVMQAFHDYVWTSMSRLEAERGS